MNKTERSNFIKRKAIELGFSHCGISEAGFLEEEAGRLEQWLKEGRQGDMTYMNNHFDKRLDPRLLVPGAKSVVSLLYNYYPKKEIFEDGDLKISKYAYGEDYHHVIKSKLKELMLIVRDEIGAVEGRVFVDSAPVLDKAWAVKSGLGWMGKHSNLINKKAGSFFFIAELIIDLELESDHIESDHCGTCTACLDACPTDAIYEPYKVDGSKCISYFTIELKESIPEEMKGRFNDWIFGCDICQDVCPWNRFSSPHNESLFNPSQKLLEMNKEDWKDLTEEVFGELFKKSAVKRTKFEGLKRNIKFVTE